MFHLTHKYMQLFHNVQNIRSVPDIVVTDCGVLQFGSVEVNSLNVHVPRTPVSGAHCERAAVG